MLFTGETEPYGGMATLIMYNISSITGGVTLLYAPSYSWSGDIINDQPFGGYSFETYGSISGKFKIEAWNDYDKSGTLLSTEYYLIFDLSIDIVPTHDKRGRLIVFETPKLPIILGRLNKVVYE
ncbi:hypothetical protein SDC9_117926 [bioreactor metagenome]|uniref:Uncharacterized protein n=1 Tax=bioreactor metagenome TaxID=1076179 RepID=A0A645C6L5_9ZZZZ